MPDDSERGLPTASSSGVTGPAFATFTNAYLAVLGEVAGSPRYEIATRGNTAQEILNVCFTVDDPLTRSPYLGRARPILCSITPRPCGTCPAAMIWR